MKERIGKDGRVYIKTYVIKDKDYYHISCECCDLAESTSNCGINVCWGNHCYKLQETKAAGSAKGEEMGNIKETKSFKVGDKVRRVNGEWAGMKVRDTGIISRVNSSNIEIKGFYSKHDPLNFELVQEEKKTFTLNHNNKEYEVTPFSLLDIWDNKPRCCEEFDKEFRALMVEMDSASFDIRIHENITKYMFESLPTLLKNIPWLIEKGLVKEIMKETLLKSGMIVKSDLNGNIKKAMITHDKKVLILETNDGLHIGQYFKDKTYSTLEKLSEDSICGFIKVSLN